MVKLIGVNKGRRVTLKYFSILIKISRKHKIILGKINVRPDFISGIVLVLTDVFIAS